MGKRIYAIRDLEEYSDRITKDIERAVLATAFTLRDKIREKFKQDASVYKHKTDKINALAEGIMVGKMNNGKVKIHAMGSQEKYDTYKTRFFVGGTEYREQTKVSGKPLQKPYTKGYIKALDSIDRGMDNANNILEEYIKNVIENGK